jgi:enoyl-CoA hydratase/3-hydroxyacyl-CoA dehydrogenase
MSPPIPFFVLNLANGNPIIIETNSLQMEEGAHYRPASVLASVDRWLTHRPGSPVEVPDEVKSAVRDRLLGILFSQSFDIIDRGIGTKADLNFGCQVALGFRKGPLDLMRDLGEDEVKRIMDRFQSERPGFPMPQQSFSAYQDFKRFILVDDIDGVKVITIRRPQAMNALNDELADEILSVFKEFENDHSVKGFIITGYGTAAFSAGADIGKFPEMLGDALKCKNPWWQPSTALPLAAGWRSLSAVTRSSPQKMQAFNSPKSCWGSCRGSADVWCPTANGPRAPTCFMK